MAFPLAWSLILLGLICGRYRALSSSLTCKQCVRLSSEMICQNDTVELCRPEQTRCMHQVFLPPANAEIKRCATETECDNLLSNPIMTGHCCDNSYCN